jgi:glutathione S-transferase
MTDPMISKMNDSVFQLYTFRLCPFAHRVRLALAEKGVASEAIEVDLKNKPAGFARISPFGKVPLLLHGEAKLWESAIINEYLDELLPDPPLMPASLSDRALARVWVKYADERLYSATHSFIFARDMGARRKLAAEITESILFLENEVMAKRPGNGPYVFGQQFTLTDIAPYPWFEQVSALEQLSEFRLPPGCVSLSKWSRMVSERSAVQQCARTKRLVRGELSDVSCRLNATLRAPGLVGRDRVEIAHRSGFGSRMARLPGQL